MTDKTSAPRSRASGDVRSGESAPVGARPTHLEPDDWDPSEEEGRVLAVMGGAVRKGYWEPPARLRVIAVMGGVELDFREASLFEGGCVVEIFALMGGVNILVPPDIDVVSEGTGMMGGFESVSHRADDSDAPLLRIKGQALRER